MVGALLQVSELVPDSNCFFTMIYNRGMRFGRMILLPEGYLANDAPAIRSIYESLGLDPESYLKTGDYYEANNQMVPPICNPNLPSQLATPTRFGKVAEFKVSGLLQAIANANTPPGSRTRDSVESFSQTHRTEYVRTYSEPQQAATLHIIPNPDRKASVLLSSSNLDEAGTKPAL